MAEGQEKEQLAHKAVAHKGRHAVETRQLPASKYGGGGIGQSDHAYARRDHEKHRHIESEVDNPREPFLRSR